jgi:hypothetical protein
MRKFACNRLYVSDTDSLSQSVVSVDEFGHVLGYAPLKDEQAATEWIGGVIVLSGEKDLVPTGDFKILLEHLTHAKLHTYAWHISDFDFFNLQLTDKSIVKRL